MHGTKVHVKCLKRGIDRGCQCCMLNLKQTMCVEGLYLLLCICRVSLTRHCFILSFITVHRPGFVVFIDTHLDGVLHISDKSNSQD